LDITKRRLRKIAEAEMLMGMYIKTCPRCGGKHILLQQAEYGDRPSYFVGCNDCGLVRGPAKTVKKAVKAWNRNA